VGRTAWSAADGLVGPASDREKEPLP